MEEDMGIKIGKHCQHARLIKEEDEDMWISSEDLRTEGSSEDEEKIDTSGKSKKKSAKKQKRSKHNFLPSLTNAIMNNQTAKEGCSTENKTTNPDYSTKSHCQNVGGEIDDEAGDLQNTWRPKRGSLKLPLITADDKELVLPNRKNKLSMVGATLPLTTREILNTPEVQKKLKYIKQLNDEFEETLTLYEMERAERMDLHKEMFQIYNNLDVQDWNGIKDEEIKEKEECKITAETNKMKGKNFIQRNIELAKIGNMSGSLTDEEKQKLCDLLNDIELEDANDKTELADENLTETTEINDTDDHVNGYSFSESDKKRLDEINLELQAFNTEDGGNDVNKFNIDLNNDKFWYKYLSRQALKDIDNKLEALYNDFEAEKINKPN